jgi:hypothetical protein
MDEVHNLVKPSRAFNKTQLKNLSSLRDFLKTAEHSVIVGLTVTPIVDDEGDLDELHKILGKNMVTSVFDGTFDGNSPVPGLFPEVIPGLQTPKIISHELMGWKDGSEGGSTAKEGALFRYWEKYRTQKAKFFQPTQPWSWSNEFLQLAKHCNVKNERYFNLKDAIACGNDEVKRKAAKFVGLADRLEADGKKTVIMCHRDNGYAPLVMYLQKRFKIGPHKVRSYPKLGDGGTLPPARSKNWQCKNHDLCSCAKCYFNRDSNALGDECRILVLEAKECSEGVSLFCTRKLHLLDVPQTWTSYVQRCVRACMSACGCVMNGMQGWEGCASIRT